MSRRKFLSFIESKNWRTGKSFIESKNTMRPVTIKLSQAIFHVWVTWKLSMVSYNLITSLLKLKLRSRVDNLSLAPPERLPIFFGGDWLVDFFRQVRLEASPRVGKLGSKESFEKFRWFLHLRQQIASLAPSTLMRASLCDIVCVVVVEEQLWKSCYRSCCCFYSVPRCSISSLRFL